MAPERQSFGPYQLLGEVSRGGMAEVHYAKRSAEPRGKIYALKRILPQYSADTHFRRYFRAETELTLSLRHPRLVSGLEGGDVEGAPYLVMEYIHGRPLSRVLSTIGAAGKKLPVPYGAFVIHQALQGLEFIHGAKGPQGQPLNIVLCDISPSNIMVGYSGEVKLIDFGIATSRLKFFEQIGTLKGKKHYMAPEQLQGAALDCRADIFSMGVCLFEVLAGQMLFSGKTEFEVEQAVRSGRFPSLDERAPHAPAGLRAVAARALSHDPATRFSTTSEFAQAIAPFARLGNQAPVVEADLAQILKLYVGPLIDADDARLEEVLTGTAVARLPDDEDEDTSEVEDGKTETSCGVRT